MGFAERGLWDVVFSFLFSCAGTCEKALQLVEVTLWLQPWV